MNAPNLEPGARGEWVEYLQRLLTEHGWYEGQIDGHFGNGTLRGVHKAQREFGLEKWDGVNGELWAALSGDPFEPIRPETDEEHGTRILSITAADVSGGSLTYTIVNEGNATARAADNCFMNLRATAGDDVGLDAAQAVPHDVAPGAEASGTMSLADLPDGEWIVELTSDAWGPRAQARSGWRSKSWCISADAGQAILVYEDAVLHQMTARGRRQSN